jgi:ornithine cyclodeaminase/alanine dehydrogenase-like protein (mu-crystallin family)
VTLVLRRQEVEGLLTLDEVIASLRGMLREQADDQAQLPPRITVDSRSGRGWLRLMPGILNGSGVMGYKAMHSTPGVGVRYVITLIDMESGALLAFVDADWVTQVRTAATAAIGTDTLARRDVEQVAVFGSSTQAAMLLACVGRVRAFKRVRVFSPTQANRERFAATVQKEHGIDARAVASGTEAAEDADVIISAIRATGAPAILASWLRPGMHVTAISSVRPEARELDEEIWSMAAAVGVDDREHVFESGDGRAAVAAKKIRPEETAELWELTCGARPGRESADAITLFKSVGTGLQDVAVANALYRRAKESGAGLEIGEFPHARK